MDLITIIFTALVVNSPKAAGVTKVRIKSENGGRDWIYEIIGDIIINRYREGESRINVDGQKKIFGSTQTPRPWNGGIVPFVISSKFTEIERQYILRSFSQISDETEKCIRFVPRSFQRDFIRISKSAHTCSSNMGQLGGEQQILLSPKCATNPTFRSITHELLHTLGFHHEQSRSDRDRYVRIHLYNVLNNHEFNFDRARVTNNELTKFGYDSIMIYGPMDFSSTGKPTMTPVQPGVILKSNMERTKLTRLDLEKIKQLYRC